MKVDFKRNIRLVILDSEDRLGEADGPNVFRLHWEFWLQLRMFYDKPLENVVMPKEAEKLAQTVEKLHTTDCGRIHLYMWGDEDGETAKSLCEFLRGGPFQVVDASTPGA